MPEAKDDGQIQFLKHALQREIKSFQKKRLRNQKLAARLKIAAVALGASTTALLGLKEIQFLHGCPANIISIVAILFSAGATAVGAMEQFFDHRWLWVTYTATLTALYAISDDFEYWIAGPNNNSKSELDKFYSRFQSTLRDVDAAWAQKRLSEASSPPTATGQAS